MPIWVLYVLSICQEFNKKLFDFYTTSKSRPNFTISVEN